MSTELHIELDRIFAARNRDNMGPPIAALLHVYEKHPLRNVGRLDESVTVFAQARREFPDSVALGAFESLSLHAAGQVNTALGSLLALLADHVQSEEIERYKPALRGNTEYLTSLDSSATSERAR